MTVSDDSVQQLHDLASNERDEFVRNEPESDIRWKSFKFHVKDVGEEGNFKGYASVWGVIDTEDEVVDKGSTIRSLKNNPNFVLLWMHDVHDPIGFSLNTTHEDEYGLWLEGQISLDCESGKQAYSLMKLAQKVGGSAKMGLSIGFRVLRKEWVKHDDGKTRLHFKEIALMETSIVTFPANRASFITSVKSEFLKRQFREQDIVPQLSDEQMQQIANFTAQKLKAEAPATAVPTETRDMDQDQSCYSTNLANNIKRRELQTKRYANEDALYDTLSAIHEHRTMTPEQKAQAIKETYHQYADAMGDWHCCMYFGAGAKAFKADDLRTKSVSTESTPVQGQPLNATALAEAMLAGLGDVDAGTKAGKHIMSNDTAKLALLGAHENLKKALRKQAIVHKDLFGADEGTGTAPGADAGAGDEMGAMGEDEPVDAAKADDVDGSADVKVADADVTGTPVETKSEDEAHASVDPQEPSDPGTHSLLAELAEITKSFTEKLSGNPGVGKD